MAWSFLPRYEKINHNMRDLLIDTMIEQIEKLPIRNLSAANVSELTAKSINTVHRWVKIGHKIDNDTRLYLKRQPNGKYLKEDLIDFLTQFKQIGNAKNKNGSYYRAVL